MIDDMSTKPFLRDKWAHICTEWSQKMLKISPPTSFFVFLTIRVADFLTDRSSFFSPSHKPLTTFFLHKQTCSNIGEGSNKLYTVVCGYSDILGDWEKCH